MRPRLPFLAILLTLAAAAAPAAAPAPAAPEPDAADRAAALAAAGIAFAGDWYATEVIVFERPRVDPAHYDEALLTDRPRVYPRLLRSLDAADGDSGTFYSTDPADPACRRSAPGAAAGRSAVPTAFLQPPRPTAIAAPVTPESSPGDQPGGTPAQPPPPPDPLEELRHDVREYEDRLADESLAWLPDTSHTLAQEAHRLTASGGFRVLFHEAWVQNLAAGAAPGAILVQAGRRDAGGSELEGTLRFGRSHTTAFEADLWYRPPGATALPAEYVELREERRLGAGELHYLDHPKLGILVRTIQVALPTDVIQAFEALDASAAGSAAGAAPATGTVNPAPAPAGAPAAGAPSGPRPPP